MTQEEAIKILKDFHDNSALFSVRTALETLHPELKESEDAFIEEFRNYIHDFTRSVGGEVTLKDNISRETIKKALHRYRAWLEKQGQEPRKVSIWRHWKDGICGNGEGKLIYLIKKNGGDYSLSSCLGYECDYILLSDLDNLMLEKQCNPTNEDMKEALRAEYEKGRADAFAQMQKEWSEEDESILQGIWDEILANKHDAKECEWKTYDKFLDWLKSLRPQNQWKPSDEQMEALYEETQKSDRIRDDRIVSLYNDLKKLKGE